MKVLIVGAAILAAIALAAALTGCRTYTLTQTLYIYGGTNTNATTSGDNVTVDPNTTVPVSAVPKL
jgi:hypothetical protein